MFLFCPLQGVVHPRYPVEGGGGAGGGSGCGVLRRGEGVDTAASGKDRIHEANLLAFRLCQAYVQLLATRSFYHDINLILFKVYTICE